MTRTETGRLVRRLIGGDPAVAPVIVGEAPTSRDPVLLVVAALLEPRRGDWLERAAALATDGRDRQLAAIAAAHLAGDRDRVDALAREHLVDHPDSILVAWIAGAPAAITHPAPTLPAPTLPAPTLPRKGSAS